MNQQLLDILACPSCKGVLQWVDHSLVCRFEQLAYPIERGIPILLIDRAKKWPHADKQQGA